MEIKTILFILLTIAVLAMVVIGVIYYVRTHTMEQIREQAYKCFLWAEHDVVGSRMGQQKLEYVIDRTYYLLPKWLQLFISKDLLRRIIDKWFIAVKDLLDDGKLNTTTISWRTGGNEND